MHRNDIALARPPRAAARSVLTVLVAVLLAGTTTGCKDRLAPGTVARKSTEGLDVTGDHYVWCKRGDGSTTKHRLPYNEWTTVKVGDPC